MFGLFVSEGVKDLCQSMIYNPHDWVQGNYYFSHKEHRDLNIWTANGVFFINLNGNAGFNIYEKRAINRAIHKSIANRLSSPPPIDHEGTNE